MPAPSRSRRSRRPPAVTSLAAVTAPAPTGRLASGRGDSTAGSGQASGGGDVDGTFVFAAPSDAGALCANFDRWYKSDGLLRDEFGLSHPFISHDLAVVRLISDEACVTKDGELVEAAPSEEVLTGPRHPCTRKLPASIPGNGLRLEP